MFRRTALTVSALAIVCGAVLAGAGTGVAATATQDTGRSGTHAPTGRTGTTDWRTGTHG